MPDGPAAWPPGAICSGGGCDALGGATGGDAPAAVPAEDSARRPRRAAPRRLGACGQASVAVIPCERDVTPHPVDDNPVIAAREQLLAAKIDIAQPVWAETLAYALTRASTWVSGLPWAG